MSSDVGPSGLQFAFSRLHDDAKGLESSLLFTRCSHLDRNQGGLSRFARVFEPLLVKTERLGAGSAPFGADEDRTDTDFIFVACEGERCRDDVQSDETTDEKSFHCRIPCDITLRLDSPHELLFPSGPPRTDKNSKFIGRCFYRNSMRGVGE